MDLTRLVDHFARHRPETLAAALQADRARRLTAARTRDVGEALAKIEREREEREKRAKLERAKAAGRGLRALQRRHGPAVALRLLDVAGRHGVETAEAARRMAFGRGE